MAIFAHKKGDTWKAVVAIIVIILIAAAVYFTFFFYYSCDDLACYNSHQKECAKTRYVSDTEDTTWLYSIKGKTDGKCEVNVKVLTVKTGSADKEVLEGKDMNCLLPIESTVSPESDLARCHGILKEELQNLIIQQLHKYIVDNVQDIGQELEDIV